MSSMVIEVKSVRGLSTPADRLGAAGPSRETGRRCPARARAAADARSAAPVRLTRRGRCLVVLVVLALAYGLLTIMSAPAASTRQVRHVRAHTVVVTSGETLWDIAKSVAPGSDPRDVVAEIVDLNALADPGAIRVGQPLDVPAK
jgi:nucleoid-associated protein YgaU